MSLARPDQRSVSRFPSRWAAPTDIGKTIHPHPTLGESIGMAAEVFEGHCPPICRRAEEVNNLNHAAPSLGTAIGVQDTGTAPGGGA